MADVEITATVHGKDDVKALLERPLGLKIRKDSQPCPACEANEDPHEVPLHDNCKCRVYVDFID